MILLVFGALIVDYLFAVRRSVPRLRTEAAVGFMVVSNLWIAEAGLLMLYYNAMEYPPCSAVRTDLVLSPIQHKAYLCGFEARQSGVNAD
jgi:hypothetical protein